MILLFLGFQFLKHPNVVDFQISKITTVTILVLLFLHLHLFLHLLQNQEGFQYPTTDVYENLEDTYLVYLLFLTTDVYENLVDTYSVYLTPYSSQFL